MSADHLAHLKHPPYVAAVKEWNAHQATCIQCQAAPGPPPHDCPPEQRELYACDEALQLHEAMVLAAHQAHREAQG